MNNIPIELIREIGYSNYKTYWILSLVNKQFYIILADTRTNEAKNKFAICRKFKACGYKKVVIWVLPNGERYLPPNQFHMVKYGKNKITATDSNKKITIWESNSYRIEYDVVQKHKYVEYSIIGVYSRAIYCSDSTQIPARFYHVNLDDTGNLNDNNSTLTNIANNTNIPNYKYFDDYFNSVWD